MWTRLVGGSLAECRDSRLLRNGSPNHVAGPVPRTLLSDSRSDEDGGQDSPTEDRRCHYLRSRRTFTGTTRHTFCPIAGPPSSRLYLSRSRHGLLRSRAESLSCERKYLCLMARRISQGRLCPRCGHHGPHPSFLDARSHLSSTHDAGLVVSQESVGLCPKESSTNAGPEIDRTSGHCQPVGCQVFEFHGPERSGRPVALRLSATLGNRLYDMKRAIRTKIANLVRNTSG